MTVHHVVHKPLNLDQRTHGLIGTVSQFEQNKIAEIHPRHWLARTPNTKELHDMIEVQISGNGNGDSSSGSSNSEAEYMSIISGHIDSLSDSLRQLSLRIHDNPEVRNKEVIAHEAITAFMNEQEDQRWSITPSAYGIATAFVADFDSGKPGPVVSFNAEYGEY